MRPHLNVELYFKRPFITCVFYAVCHLSWFCGNVWLYQWASFFTVHWRIFEGKVDVSARLIFLLYLLVFVNTQNWIVFGGRLEFIAMIIYEFLYYFIFLYVFWVNIDWFKSQPQTNREQVRDIKRTGGGRSIAPAMTPSEAMIIDVIPDSVISG